MRGNPADNWAIEDIARLCSQHDIRCMPPSGGGSHWKVSDPSQRDILNNTQSPTGEAGLHQETGEVCSVGGGCSPMSGLSYPVVIEPLAEEDGEGFVALVPDLPGCMSDGETAEAALASVKDAIAAWIDEAKALGRSVPTPSRHLVAAE
jgi:antitoxin HicB